MIDRSPIAPCLCEIKVIKELIKTGNLSRLKSLLRDQGALQRPEYGSPYGRVWKWIPDHAEFRVELVFDVIQEFAVDMVVAESNGKRHIL